MLKLDPDDPRPPYRQLADGLRSEIDRGNFGPGAKLPSYGEIGLSFGVSPGVVKRAMAQLRDERVIVIRHGQGSYVRTEPATPGRTSDADLATQVADLSRRLTAVEQRLAEM